MLAWCPRATLVPRGLDGPAMNLHSLQEIARAALGLHVSPAQMTFAQMAARTLVVFVFAIALLRLGHRRFLGRSSGYDIFLMVTLGSVVSRAINGAAAFFPTLGASAVLVMLHSLLSIAAFHSHHVSLLAKGRDRLLVKDGNVIADAVRHSHITADDLLENLRLAGNLASVAEVKEARLERNGSISVIKREA